MKIYNKEKKEILKLEIELAIKNLDRCSKFVHSLEINNETYHEYEQLLDEYILLNNLRKDLSCSMYYDEDLAVCDADYLLIKKWDWLSLQEYKTFRSNNVSRETLIRE